MRQTPSVFFVKIKSCVPLYTIACSCMLLFVVANSACNKKADESRSGVFAAGCASDALDVNRAVQSATASALRAVQIVNRNARAEVQQ